METNFTACNALEMLLLRLAGKNETDIAKSCCVGRQSTEQLYKQKPYWENIERCTYSMGAH